MHLGAEVSGRFAARCPGAEGVVASGHVVLAIAPGAVEAAAGDEERFAGEIVVSLDAAVGDNEVHVVGQAVGEEHAGRRVACGDGDVAVGVERVWIGHAHGGVGRVEALACDGDGVGLEGQGDISGELAGDEILVGAAEEQERVAPDVEIGDLGVEEEAGRDVLPGRPVVARLLGAEPAKAAHAGVAGHGADDDGEGGVPHVVEGAFAPRRLGDLRRRVVGGAEQDAAAEEAVEATVLAIPDHADGLLAIEERLAGRQAQLEDVVGVEADGVAVGDAGIGLDEGEGVAAALDGDPVVRRVAKPGGAHPHAARHGVPLVGEEPADKLVLVTEAAVALAGMLPVADAVAPSLEHRDGVAGVLDLDEAVGVAVVDEDGGVEEGLGAGEAARPLVLVALAGGERGEIVLVEPDVVVPPAVDGSDGGEELGVGGADVPGASAAHRVAGEVDAVVVDGEGPLRLGDGAEDVGVADPPVAGVAAAVGLEDDEAVALGEGVVAGGDAPPAGVGRVAGVVAVEDDGHGPALGRVVAGRQTGAGELGGAVGLVDPGEADEAVGPDGRAGPHGKLAVFHQRAVDRLPVAGLRLPLAGVAAEAVEHDIAEDAEPRVEQARRLLGQPVARIEQRADLRQPVALVPRQVAEEAGAVGHALRDADLEGAVRPRLGGEADLRAPRRRRLRHDPAAGGDGLNEHRLGVLDREAEAGVRLDQEHVRRALGRLPNGRAHLAGAERRGLLRAEHAQHEAPAAPALLDLHEQTVRALRELDPHDVLVSENAAGDEMVVDERPVQPDADPVVTADGEEGLAFPLALDGGAGVGHDVVGGPAGEQLGEVDSVPGRRVLGPCGLGAVGPRVGHPGDGLDGRLTAAVGQVVGVEADAGRCVIVVLGALVGRVGELAADEPGAEEARPGPRPGHSRLLLEARGLLVLRLLDGRAAADEQGGGNEPSDGESAHGPSPA